MYKKGLRKDFASRITEESIRLNRKVHERHIEAGMLFVPQCYVCNGKNIEKELLERMNADTYIPIRGRMKKPEIAERYTIGY